MTQQTAVLCLVSSYVALGVLCSLILLRLEFSRTLRVTVISTLSLFYIATFFWMQGLLGWSAEIALPSKFKLIAARIVEPNALNNNPGAIHLWVEKLDDRNLPSGVPRSYLLPYSAAMASKVADANEKVKKGAALGGTANAFQVTWGAGNTPEGVTVRNVTQGATPGGDPSGGGILDPAAVGGQSKALDFIPLPPPVLPPKGLPKLAH